MSEYEDIANIIVGVLLNNGTTYMNLEFKKEMTQLDILFAYRIEDYGIHQRGCKYGDLFVGVTGFGFHGFRTDIWDTDVGYYEQKLGLRCEGMAELINLVRQKIGESR